MEKKRRIFYDLWQMSFIFKVISCWFPKGWLDNNSLSSFRYTYLSNKTRNLTYIFIDILKYQYANNGNIMRTIESRLLNEEILLKVLYCRSLLIYILWMSKIKTGYFFRKRFRVCIRGKNHWRFRSRCGTLKRSVIYLILFRV